MILTPENKYFERNFKSLLPPWTERDLCKVLDFGCGNGSFLTWIHDNGIYNYEGFEPEKSLSVSPGNFHIKKITKSDPLTFLRNRKSEYDFIMCKEVLYYFEKKEIHEAFKALTDALRPGGTLVVQVFNGAMLTGMYPMTKDTDIKFAFSEGLLMELAEEQDCFKSIDLKSEQLGWMRFIGLCLHTLFLRWLYTIERGRCESNPKIFSKALILVAIKKGERQ